MELIKIPHGECITLSGNIGQGDYKTKISYISNYITKCGTYVSANGVSTIHKPRKPTPKIYNGDDPIFFCDGDWLSETGFLIWKRNKIIGML